MRIIIVGSHPCACDSISKLVYALVETLRKSHTVVVYSDHRSANVVDSDRHRQTSDDVRLVNAVDEHLTTVIAKYSPNVILAIGDTRRIALTLDVCPDVPIVAYFQMYFAEVSPSQLETLNRCKCVVVSSAEFAESLSVSGVTVPVHTIAYGVDPKIVYPVPKSLARRIYSIPEDQFTVLNLNTNSVRKRWDLCLMAWALVVKEYHETKVGRFPVLIIATDMMGAWDLARVYDLALSKHALSLKVGLSHLLHIDAQRKLSDHSVNVLYNATDVGVSIGEAEAVGLCAKEHSSVGRAVIVSDVPGHTHHVRPDIGVIVPCTSQYVLDSSRPDVGCVGGLVSPRNVADELIRFRRNPKISDKLATRGLYHSRSSWSGPCADLTHILESQCNAIDV